MMGKILVLSPLEYEVFQREKQDGYIEFNGCVKEVSKLFVTIEGVDYLGNNVSIKQDLPFENTGVFNTNIKVPAGGWYKVEIHYVSQSGESVYTAKHVGVGEVFVTAGQSKFTNSGQYRTEQTSGMVSACDGINWSYMQDPVPGVHDNTQGGSPFCAMGDALYNEFKVPIGFICAGHGGSATVHWQPGEIFLDNKTGIPYIDNVPLFEWLMERILKRGKKSFRCMLWDQGESDEVNKTQIEYYLRLNNIVERSRAVAGWYIPWMIAKASYTPWGGVHDLVRDAQQKLIDDGIVMAGPDTDVLLGDYRDYDGCGAHFSPKGLKKHGEMWAECLKKYIHTCID